ncbi:hypothetical protein HZS_3967, partial [Henneguya salminicola]
VRTIKDTMELERKFKDIKINEDIDYFLSGLSGDESIRNESMLELIKKLSDFNFLNAVTKSKALNNIIEKSIDLCRDHNSIYLSLCVCLILIKNDQFNSCSSSIITIIKINQLNSISCTRSIENSFKFIIKIETKI